MIYKVGDLVRLNKNYVKKVMEHNKVFELYHERGAPRDWIQSLCNQTPMRVLRCEQDDTDACLITLSNDPSPAVWQQEWFELVAHNNFVEEDDLFAI